MATKRPKITFVSHDEDHEILKRLAANQSTSVSKIVSELIHEVIPQLRSLVETLEEAKAASEKLTPEAKARLREKMEGKEAEALQDLEEFKQALDDGFQMGLDMISEEFKSEQNSGNEKA